MTRKSIKNLNLQEVSDFFKLIEEKEYRAKQLFSWIYEKNVESFSEMTNFSKKLRVYLDDTFEVSPLKLTERNISEIDGTEKYLFKTYDNHYIESVLIRNEGTDNGRLTVCVSSQIGCAMGCVFCYTGKMGFHRNLETGEIIDQICHIRRLSGLKNNNVVFMGMGEPFMNYENVIKAAGIMNYTFGFHISARKITISTSGIKDSIERYIDEKRPYNLAISLNDTLPEKRRIHMPVERIFPFSEICSMLEKKFPVSRNRLTIEYIMRKDNITPDDAKRLKKMFKYQKIKLNLIPLNKSAHYLEYPSDDEIGKFISELEIMNVPISLRKSLGSDIYGACGQLSGKY